MPQFKKAGSAKQGLTPEMKKNIIQAALQRSINYYLELRNSVDPKSSDYHDYGKKVSSYITVKNSV
jgi:hypothetical protein